MIVHMRSFIDSFHDLAEVKWQFLDLGIVVLSEVGQELSVSGGDEVDSDSLSSEPARSTDSVDVLGSVGGQVVVDDQVHLLDVDTSAQEIGRDEDAGRARTELLHHVHTLRHLHVAADARNHELVLGQLVGQLLDALLPVGEDHALRNDHVLVELDQGAELLAVLLKGDVELLDTVKGELLVLDEDLDWVLHELVGHLDDLWWHGCREEADLDVVGQVLENLTDLVDKASAEHLVSLVQDHDFEVVGLQGLPLDEIFDPAGGADNNLDAAISEGIPIFLGVGAADAASGADVEELTEAEDDLVDLLREFTSGGEDDGLAFWGLGVDELEDSDGKGGGFACAGLRLSDGVSFVDDGQNTLLLNDGWLLKTEG